MTVSVRPPRTTEQTTRYVVSLRVRGVLRHVANFATVEAARARELEELAKPERLLRRRGTVCRDPRNHEKFLAKGPRPRRKYLGVFPSKWAAEKALESFLRMEDRP